LFRRHKGSQTPQGTGFVTIVPSDRTPEEFARELDFMLRRRMPHLSQHDEAEQPATPGWTTSFCCSCGGGMYPCAIVSATQNSKTVRMKTNGCDHTVDVTYTVGPLASGQSGSPYRVPLSRNARQVLTDSLMRDEMLAEEPDQVATIVKDLLMDLQEAGLEIVASGDVE
jgi:hypothetical protein